jgi:peptide/nickel transport system substrate-binding protein
MRSTLLSFPVPSSALALAAAALVAATGCRGGQANSADAPDGGTLVAALQTEVTHLVPPALAQVEGKTVADQIFESLARVGDQGYVGADRGFRGALADSWTWERDSLALVFRLNPAARWHDGTPVRASDVRFTFALYTDPAVGSGERASLSRIDSVTVRDSATAVFWFAARYPDQFYDAAARMLIVPEHRLSDVPRASLTTSEFARNPIGSGRFRLSQWAANESIELVADTTHHRGRPHLDRVIFAVTPDANALTARLASGEIDAAEIGNAAQFRTLSQDPDLGTRILPAFDYAYLQFNLRDPRDRDRPHPIFGDVALRRALFMAVDRAQLVRSQLDTLGAVALGPMTRAQPLADTTAEQIPFDTAAAARTLDSLGWRLPPGKAVRERDGRPLRFSVLVPSISPNRMAMVVRLQEAMRRVGVQLDMDAVEANAFMARMAKRDFDALFNGIRAEVSISGLKAYWSTAASLNPQGRNFSSYENPRFDAHLDSALSAPDEAAARAHARQAFAEIIADVPAIWMYEVRTAPVIHHRFRTARVLPGAWWAGFADWSVPADARIPRDRVGPRMVAR